MPGRASKGPSIPLSTCSLLSGRTSAGLQVNRSPQAWPRGLALADVSLWPIIRLLGQIYFTARPRAGPLSKAGVGEASWDQLPGLSLGRKLMGGMEGRLPCSGIVSSGVCHSLTINVIERRQYREGCPPPPWSKKANKCSRETTHLLTAWWESGRDGAGGRP